MAPCAVTLARSSDSRPPRARPEAAPAGLAFRLRGSRSCSPTENWERGTGVRTQAVVERGPPTGRASMTTTCRRASTAPPESGATTTAARTPTSGPERGRHRPRRPHTAAVAYVSRRYAVSSCISAPTVPAGSATLNGKVHPGTTVPAPRRDEAVPRPESTPPGPCVSKQAVSSGLPRGDRLIVPRREPALPDR